MKNIELAVKVVTELVETGVEEFILCAGARNSPFIQVFAENPHLKVYNFFEERSAAFFALGRMAASRRPVAVFTTSGTAVAELLPAAVEATYSSLPLIMVTADRPKEYRGSGAPQAIEQLGIFSYYIEVALDVDAENSHISFKNLSWKKPVQVNVSFDEPLIDAPVPKIVPSKGSEWTKLPEQVPMNTLHDIEAFLETHHPLIIVGYVPGRAHQTVIEFIQRYQAPVYLEGISGLRGHPQLKDFEVQSGEKMLLHLIEDHHCDSVMRIGGVPTVRLWRDLEERFKDLPVLSVSYNHYTGLSRSVAHFNCMEALSQVEVQSIKKMDPTIFVKDKEIQQQMNVLYQKWPQSEPSLIHQLSMSLTGQNIYLGNSLPIREWDLAANRSCPPARVVGNRGANGIDGQLSSFLGWANTQAENWAIVGDLTAMYDLSAPWVISQLDKSLILRLVIVNNRGGQIFKRMFNNPLYLNEHQVSFEHFAKMWGWSYQCWNGIPEKIDLSQRAVIELCPDSEQTENFWNELASLWKK